MSDEYQAADEAAVVWLEREGLINPDEARALRQKIATARKWKGRRIQVKATGQLGYVTDVNSPDWLYVQLDGQNSTGLRRPDELELYR